MTADELDVHQPGSTGGPPSRRSVDGDPPDAVGANDEKGGGPEERAPEAPDAAHPA